MTRGTLVWVNFGDTTPPEFGKTRPALIVSNSEHNQRLSTVVVIPLSSRPPDIWPLRLALSAPLKTKGSYAIVPGLRQVSKTRLMDVIGRLNADSMQRVEDALFAYLRE